MWKRILFCLIIFCCRLGETQDKLLIVDVNTDLKSLESESGRRIVGGSPSSVEKYPFVVQIFVNDRLLGGGTILSHIHILTCAHILVNKKNNKIAVKKFSIRSGTSIANQGGTRTTVRKTAVHPKFHMEIYYDDIGLIFLDKDLEYKKSQGPAAVAHNRLVVPDGALVTVMGWGKGRNGEQEPRLQEVTIPVVNHKECVRRYSIQGHNITQNMICAGVLDVGDKDTCQGDSGGPLVYMTIVVGLTSWGVDCGHPVYPGIYTKISAYLDWIQKETGLGSALRSDSIIKSVNLIVYLSLVITVLANKWLN